MEIGRRGHKLVENRYGDRNQGKHGQKPGAAGVPGFSVSGSKALLDFLESEHS
jgi:hypothetical protein